MLHVTDLTISARTRHGLQPLVKNVSFSLETNQCLGILGESGSGKSLTCKAVMGLLGDEFDVQGEVLFQGQNLLSLPEHKRRKLRGKEICMVIQNAMTAFNPLFSLENQLLETLRTHLDEPDPLLRKRILEAFEKMNLYEGETLLLKYPHQLSGGMLQRVMIALCIALNPVMIIADEPTTAIDVVNQVEIIQELKKVRDLFRTTMIFISHDLGVLCQLCDTLLVMHQGEKVEQGSVQEVIFAPKAPQTQMLIQTRLELLRAFHACTEVTPCS